VIFKPENGKGTAWAKSSGDFITTKPKFLENLTTSILNTSAKICDPNCKLPALQSATN